MWSARPASITAEMVADLEKIGQCRKPGVMIDQWRVRSGNRGMTCMQLTLLSTSVITVGSDADGSW